MPLFEAKPRRYFIELERPQAAYFPGQPITGRVVMELGEQVTARGVFVTLLGTAHTHFSTGSGKHRHHHRQTVNFVEVPLALWTPPAGTEKSDIPVGNYVFPFTFVLPVQNEWPASFRGRSGHIAYVLRSHVDRPWKWDFKAFCGISVMPLIDTNHPSFAVQPRRQDEKTICCCCCAQGPIVCDASVPAAAWCPGETLCVSIRVQNNSRTSLPGIVVALHQLVIFHAGGHRSYAYADVQRTAVDTVLQPRSDRHFDVQLLIPACCPTISLASSRLIEVGYSICVVVRTGAGSMNFAVPLPVTIGTVPHLQPTAATEVRQWADPNAVLAAASRNLVQPAAPPPAYEDVYQHSEPDYAALQGTINYPYFSMPPPSAPPAPVSSSQQQQQQQWMPPPSGVPGFYFAPPQATPEAPPPQYTKT